MRGFHLYLHVLGVGSIKDTQCGFKLFTRDAALEIFPCLHVEGWIFDIEILHVAQSLALKVSEVAVNWEEVEGSKVSLIKDSIKMALDLLIIRLNYALGVWKIRPRHLKSR
jgi:dolichyl-phosphate beta-glucosyltransferase